MKSVYLIMNYIKMWFHEFFSREYTSFLFFHTAWCGNCCALVSHVFAKISWKQRFHQRVDLTKYFFLWETKVFFFHSTVWKNKKLLWRKKCPSNQFSVKFLCKNLIWRNFWDKIEAVKLRNFHTQWQTKPYSFKSYLMKLS